MGLGRPNTVTKRRGASDRSANSRGRPRREFRFKSDRRQPQSCRRPEVELRVCTEKRRIVTKPVLFVVFCQRGQCKYDEAVVGITLGVLAPSDSRA
eukprot:6187220-Pleurochrysis_carterae.AAC.1